MAGLEVVRIINEPTAAALAYGLDKGNTEEKIMVFDFGGGTLDVTVMDFGGNVFEVKSTSGDTQLGGTDMDNVLVEYLAGEFRKETGVELKNDRQALARLREAGEKAKIELSTVFESAINLPFLSANASGPQHFTHQLTRAKLEELVNPIVERCKKPVERALADGKIGAGEVTKVILVGGPTRMPIVQKFVQRITGKTPERGVDPMECVAVGAAIQAGVLSGEVKDLLLLDVTPLSLGIETLGGVFTKLIERNTTIPSKKTQVFSTAADSQTSVDVHVLQGERAMSKDNIELGRFTLMGIPPAPRGVPQIEVAFDIDANGIIHVSAKDLGTGKEQKLKIVAPHKMKEDEIKKKVKDAEEFAEADKKAKEEVEEKNEAEALIYTSEKTLDELKEKVSEEQKKEVKEASEKLKEALKEGKVEEIKEKKEALSKKLQEIGTKIYEQAGAQRGSQAAYEEEGKGGDAGEGKGEKVVDADYEKVDEKGEGKKKK
ncbi:molecular chaperone DnaK [Candidatus Micrarchaeota archaeon CG11_big_fil_rev_8_21_14_0_20_47_5]|nr:MAG: molecular chaperone DnaK [Candidatus Micrarchaeota archaeon CG11_big_fil_rev_8_21_14_0_20_47_5]